MSDPTNPLLTSRDMEGIRVMRAEPKKVNEIQYTGVGRNESCPCGSGKKFKHCHGK